MHMLTEDRNRQSDDRLRMKTQDDTLMRAAMDGAGLPPWEARALPELVDEMYFSQPSDADPLRDGQMFYQCTALKEGAGKPLKDCHQVQVRLTLHDHGADKPLHRERGQAAVRRQITCRITEEARAQGGLLRQEDVAYLLHTSERTVRRDVALLAKPGSHVAARGFLRDIGPSVSHQGIAIQHWLAGKEPVDSARAINHRVQAVDRSLNDFRRIVFILRQGHDKVTAARMTRLSESLVAPYVAIYNAVADNEAYAYRWQEIKLQLGRLSEQNTEKNQTNHHRSTDCPSHSVPPTKTPQAHS